MNRVAPSIIHKRAVISKCGDYRYWLSREILGAPKPKPIVFIMLNPSTADAEHDDPTIRRCISFAKAWDGSHLIVVNLFAYRTTNPRTLWAEDTVDPVGQWNNDAIDRAMDYAYAWDGLVVAAWGEHGSYMGRNEDVLNRIQHTKPMCLKLNKSGNPAHPLYQPKDSVLIPIS